MNALPERISAILLADGLTHEADLSGAVEVLPEAQLQSENEQQLEPEPKAERSGILRFLFG